jgi:V/A-type H+-transporting ATPase subunit A
MSGRLEEMPGEEGYPAYLSTRLAEFYERAGSVKCLGDRYGAITAIGAVSPPGGDTSEPVSQATLRIVKVFWGLSAELAYKRHFPAIDWLKSYSLYEDKAFNYYNEKVSDEWSENVRQFKAILGEESELQEIVRLIGFDALGEKDRITLECARSIREDFLQQDSFREVDRYTSSFKQGDMMSAILLWYKGSLSALELGATYKSIMSMKVLEKIAKMKYQPEENWKDFYKSIQDDLIREFAEITKGGEEN